MAVGQVQVSDDLEILRADEKRMNEMRLLECKERLEYVRQHKPARASLVLMTTSLILNALCVVASHQQHYSNVCASEEHV